MNRPVDPHTLDDRHCSGARCWTHDGCRCACSPCIAARHDAANPQPAVTVQERFGKIYIVGAGDTEEEAKANLEEIKAAMVENRPMLGAPVRFLGSRGQPKRIEAILEVDDGYRVRLEGEQHTRSWRELEYYV